MRGGSDAIDIATPPQSACAEHVAVTTGGTVRRGGPCGSNWQWAIVPQSPAAAGSSQQALAPQASSHY